MNSQLKVIQAEKGKGKWATKTQEGTDELALLMTFNQSITHAMVTNFTLLRRDSF